MEKIKKRIEYYFKPILIMDKNYQVISANNSFYEKFKVGSKRKEEKIHLFVV